MSSLEQAVLQQHHVLSKASLRSAWLCQHQHIHSYASEYTLTEAWHLASLLEISSPQASLPKTYMRIVSQESKQLVSHLFRLNAQLSRGFFAGGIDELACHVTLGVRSDSLQYADFRTLQT